MDKTIAHYSGLPVNQINRLLNMRQSQIYADVQYQSWVDALDSQLLYDTLNYAREAYENNLGVFHKILKDQYNLNNTPMSSYTLGNWLVGFVQVPSKLSELVKMHNNLPLEAVMNMLPQMITMLDEMPEGREEWQKALALIALPLAATRD